VTKLDYEPQRPGKPYGKWFAVLAILSLTLLGGLGYCFYFVWFATTPGYNASPELFDLSFILSVLVTLASLIGMVLVLILAIWPK
jgi:hypothetical protein